MSKINQQTKEKILRAAEIIFHENGFKGARTTLMAQKAGVSRTMLHYYYRTKEDLFQEVLQNSFGHFIQYAQQLFEKNYDLKSLIDKIVDLFCDSLEEKPSFPSFIVNILNESPDLIMNLPFIKEEHLPALFDELLKTARSKKEIASEISGEDLFLNLLGLSVMPYLVAPMIKSRENRTEEAFKSFLQNRRTMIKSFVWNSIQN